MLCTEKLRCLQNFVASFRKTWVVHTRHTSKLSLSISEGPKMSLASAAKYMKKSKSFVKKWVQQYIDTKTESMISRKVDKKKQFRAKDDKKIVNLF